VTHGKRVLITGAGGFIGRWSVPPLLRRGFEVHVVLSGAAQHGVDARRGVDARHLPEQLQGATVQVADLLQESDVEELMKRVAPTHLLHFAWIATPGLYWSSADNYRWLAASQHLLRCFGTYGGLRAVMAGSCAEYDWARVGVCEERSSPLADEMAASPYAACKMAMQQALADYGRLDHVSTAWGRIFFQFGPHEHPDRLVPSVIRNLLRDQEARVSHGRQVRSFLHVADVGSAFAAVLDSALQGPVNIGSDQRIALAELIDRIARQIGRPDLVRLGAREEAAREPEPERQREPTLLVPDIHRLRDEVQWRPAIGLDEGLKGTIDWWRRRLVETSVEASS